jgi:hypothetical protein
MSGGRHILQGLLTSLGALSRGIEATELRQ